MSAPEPNRYARPESFDEVLAEFLQRLDRGEAVDRERFLAEHPALAGDLRSYLDAADEVERLARPGPTSAGEEASPSAPLGVVRYLGQYELLEEIARGGMGVVYKARQVPLNRTVAVKLILAGPHASEDDVRRFRTEAEAAAGLRHPHIVAIHEVGACDGRHYFSMDYIEGQSLAELVREQPLPPRRAAEIVRVVAGAVHYAHERGVLHRDLKPSNILLDGEGRPHVTDFGLARRLQADSGLTATGQVVGTPCYMPPEQAAGRTREVSARSDVYALGAVLYELLVARPPFHAASVLETLRQVLDREPVPPRVLDPGVPRDLEVITLKCLEKDPRRRYGSAQELADDLGRFLNGEPIKARRLGPVGRAWRWCRRNPWPTAATAALVLLVAVLTTWGVTLRGQLWQSLVEQARAERLAGDRDRALDLLGRAARMRRTPELRQEVIQALTSPRLRRRLRLPGHTIDDAPPRFAHGGRLLIGRYLPPSVLEETTLHLQPADAPHDEREYLNAWDPVTGRLVGETPRSWNVFPYRLHTGAGTHLVVLSRHPNEGRVWDPVAGESRWTFEGSPRLLSPDGRLLAVSTDWTKNDTIRVLDVHRRATLPIRSSGQPLAFLDGSLLLEQDGRVRALDLAAGGETYRTPAGTRLIAVSPNGRVAALDGPKADRKGRALLTWDLAAGRELQRLDAAVPAEVFFSHDGSVLAFRDAAAGSVLRVWDVRAGRFRPPIAGLLAAPPPGSGKPALNADGSLLAARSGNRTLGIWETSTGRSLGTLQDQGLPAWTGDGDTLATEGRMWITPRGTVTRHSGFPRDQYSTSVWEVSHTPSYALEAGVHSLALSPDGTRLASNGVVWEVVSGPRGVRLCRSGEAIGDRLLYGNEGRVWAADIVPEQGREGKTLRVRQLAPQAQEPAAEFPGLGFTESFVISPDGKYLVLARKGGDPKQPSINEPLQVWDPGTGERLAEWDAAAQWRVLRLSPDGQLVAGEGANSGGLQVREVPSGRLLHHLYNNSRTERRWDWKTWGFKQHHIMAIPALKSLVFSPDGGRIYSGDLDGKIHAFDLQAGQERGPWLGHREAVTALAVSPDGRMLASGSEDRTIRLWDTTSGRELACWEAHESGVTALAFSGDGQALFSGSGEGLIKVWNLPPIRKALADLGLDW